MTDLLVDTHALLWHVAGDRRLSRRARTAIENPDVEKYVSAASAWEIATKTRLGKLGGGMLATAFTGDRRGGRLSRVGDHGA